MAGLRAMEMIGRVVEGEDPGDVIRSVVEGKEEVKEDEDTMTLNQRARRFLDSALVVGSENPTKILS